MPHLSWAIPVEQVITDQRTNNVSYLNAIEGYAADDFPHLLAPVTVAMSWWRQEEEEAFVARIRVHDPSDEIIAESFTKTVRFENYTRYRINFAIEVSIKDDGEHWIRVASAPDKDSEEWEVQANLPILVVPEADVEG